ncbi:MAG TPA: homoserine kinase [Rhodocyclaceae bacterium]|nr:homoserine kinase [Rhodocyclaceae bacterium]
MSVYTAVGRDELAAWLRFFPVGNLIDLAGIAAGVENSNYFVTTAGGRWVLTLFERLPADELDFYLRLMAHLADRGYPCPRPQTDSTGALWRPLAGKPATLVSRLEGKGIETPTPDHCRAIGAALGRLHRLSADFSPALPNPRGDAWRRQTGARLLPLLPRDEHDLLADELAFQAAQDYSGLPRGVVHADLFRDNVLWRDGELSGVLDFYFAGEDNLLFDLAVAANDWCFDQDGLDALLAGYGGERPLAPAETAAWPALRRAAALRFWLSRLDDSHHPRPGEVVTVKDPGHFGRMLERLRLVAGGSAG